MARYADSKAHHHHQKTTRFRWTAGLFCASLPQESKRFILHSKMPKCDIESYIYYKIRKIWGVTWGCRLSKVHLRLVDNSSSKPAQCSKFASFVHESVILPPRAEQPLWPSLRPFGRPQSHFVRYF
jgi:hypothetical protein